jgi:hypothetical protein
MARDPDRLSAALTSVGQALWSYTWDQQVDRSPVTWPLRYARRRPQLREFGRKDIGNPRDD